MFRGSLRGLLDVVAANRAGAAYAYESATLDDITKMQQEFNRVGWGELHERLWLVTENKCFARMTNAEVVRGPNLSEKAIENDQTFARTWLAKRFGGGDDT